MWGTTGISITVQYWTVQMIQKYSEILKMIHMWLQDDKLAKWSEKWLMLFYSIFL